MAKIDHLLYGEDPGALCERISMLSVFYLLFFFLLSLGLTLAFMPGLIRVLHRLKFGQTEREEGLASHKKKSGTPTMGGIIFIVVPLFCYLIAVFFTGLRVNESALILFISLIGYGVIGFVDDFKIVVQKDNQGLKPLVKFLLQSVLAVSVYLIYVHSHSTGIWIPLIDRYLELGPFYFILIFLLFTGTTNAVNLTDGVDGLCAGQTIIALIPFLIIAWLNSSFEVFLIIILMIASLLGYLRFNFHPAKIFMGDTGSLALGGLLAALAMILKEEILFILIAGVFVFETLSVMIQVFWFKRTKKRIFLMAPFHHHLEKKGLSEVQVVFRLWTAGIICAVLSLIVYFC